MENIFKDLEALNPKTAKSYVDEQYELNRPLRIAACNKYYENRPKFKTFADAVDKAKKGYWICHVKTPDGTEFYTEHFFQEKWVRKGDVYGMWNEITLIIKNTSKSGTR